MSKTSKRPTLGGGKGLDILFGGGKPVKEENELPSSFTKLHGQPSDPDNNPPGQDPDKKENPDDNPPGQDPDKKENPDDNPPGQDPDKKENPDDNPPGQDPDNKENPGDNPPGPLTDPDKHRLNSLDNNTADYELDRKPIFIHLTKNHRRKLDNLVSELRYMTDKTHDNSSVIRGLIDFATHHLDDKDGFFKLLIDKYFEKEVRPSKKSKK